ncbi:MAG: hypothetical protein II697_06635 [Clostridia bacterium]|nr:hypothetical protein [Clostridia bacterium]
MKKILSLVLSLVLLVSAFGTLAETESVSFEALSGLEWSFTSGAGAWSTDLRILEDGSFAGEFHDSEMGESDEKYPDGTVYLCSFTGQMTLLGANDEYSWKVRVENLTIDSGMADEEIDGTLRFVKTEPYGISAGDEMLLYRPGTPISVLPEDMHMWAHVLPGETEASELENWFLSNPKAESGFISWDPQADVSIANPWVEMSKDEFLAAGGMTFALPEDAQNVVYRYLASQELSETQFTLFGDEFCARIQPADLEPGDLMDISGMYFDWENVEEVEVSYCPGIVSTAKTGSDSWAEVCLWYDIVPGLMYSLTVSTADPDGLDLAAIAEQIFVPAQGDA